MWLDRICVCACVYVCVLNMFWRVFGVVSNDIIDTTCWSFQSFSRAHALNTMIYCERWQNFSNGLTNFDENCFERFGGAQLHTQRDWLFWDRENWINIWLIFYWLFLTFNNVVDLSFKLYSCNVLKNDTCFHENGSLLDALLSLR